MQTNNDFNKKYTIEDLSEFTGFTRRTIRFYIQENIIEPPAGRGRGGFYFDSHLDNLLKIKELQDKGLNLESIRKILNRVDTDLNRVISLPEENNRKVWAKYEISDGIEFNIRRDVEINNNKKISEIIKLISLIIKENENE